jgi:hypothetical protein
MSLIIDYGIKAWKKAEEANGFDLTINYFLERYYYDIFYYKINEETTYTEIDGPTSITIPNVTQITFYYTSYGGVGEAASYHNITGSYTISGDYYILNEPMIINFYTSSCFIEGTQISLANGLTKNAEDITYDDELLVWNFDEGKFDTAKPIWIKEKGVTTKYLESTYSDGTILKTTGRMPSAHRIFNKELNKFTSLGKEETAIGTTTFTSLGEEVTLTNIKYVSDTVNYYSIITDKHINLFANTILTSCRLSNLYAIKDMKYIKDDRALNENFGIPKDLFKGLRIAEQPINLKAENFDTTIEQYVKHMMHIQKEKK